MTETKAWWDRCHSSSLFPVRYPNEHVIRWAFGNFPRDRAATFRLLDAGSGAGRHAVFFAREGYLTSAVDSSPAAITEVGRWASAEGVMISAEVASAEALPFEDESFDGVLSFGVLYYLPYRDILKSIDEIHRVLRSGGRALVMMKSNDDARSLHSTRLDDVSYRVEREAKGMSWKGDIGMTLTLLGREAMKTCFQGFRNVVIERSTVSLADGSFNDDEWMVYAGK